ncbi:MAG: LLM class F420-dependent oxidoreductase [Acidimicrobiaceae bacterium]|nr:LLM class F420-dependent oxidoreductase [Acidimicrobiaceae bacterium]
MQDIKGVGVWSTQLRYGDAGEVVEAAAELDELGYSALWIPDIGGDVFGAVDRLLASTKSATVATGILNLWKHPAEKVGAEHARLVKVHGDRFLVGIGVSHAPLIDADQPGTYRKPLATMSSYLDGLDAAPVPLPTSTRVLAALGPKMLELARTRAAGAHPYNVPPEHTALAREALGPSALLLPEQMVALETDPEQARAIGRATLEHYMDLPNYANNLRRLGFSEEDITGGPSSRLVDALVAWGTPDAIAARVREHRDAGANHVCIQVLGPPDRFPRAEWRELAPALTGL